MKIEATIDVTTWHEQDYDATAPKLAEAHFGYTYTGDLKGTGAARGHMVYRDDEHADFTGLERVTVENGTFVVRLAGSYEAGTLTYDWSVLPGTATGALTGLTGSGTVHWIHGESGHLTATLDGLTT